MAERKRNPQITVLAGTNGAGKSSVAGATLRTKGGEYFNPDEATQRFLAICPTMTEAEANSAAWHQGRRLLEQAIEQKRDFVFETTLGGNTITNLLEKASLAGMDVCVWFVGLASPELHLARVHARVARGGHDIPEDKIRERYQKSRLNLIRLLPRLAELLLYDNSAEADPTRGIPPHPVLLLHMKRGRIVKKVNLATVPQWAKPILAAALKTFK